MSLRALLPPILACLILGGCQSVDRVAAAGVGRGASVALDDLVKESRERSLDLFPLLETASSGPGPRQHLVEIYFSDEHRARQTRHHEWVRSKLALISLADLSPTEQLTHRLLARESERSLAMLQFPLHQHSVFIQLNGGVPFDLVRLIARQPLRNEADYRAWITRMRAYPAFFDAAQTVMRDGMASGMVLPRAVVNRTLVTLSALAVPEAELEQSALWNPMRRLPTSIDATTGRALEAEYRALLAAEVIPAARRLLKFAHDEYLPRARSDHGIGALPRGAEMYRQIVRFETTTEMTPDEIHALGLKEVERIQQRLKVSAAHLGYMGSIKDLAPWMRTKPEYRPFKTGQEVLDHLNAIHARIVPQLGRLFGRMPIARFEIQLTDPAIAASAPAQWYPPSNDGARPGIFAIPVVVATERTSYNLPSLLAHEGMPGHHFDGSIKREVGLPEFRRQLSINVFGEGWGLYAESLGEELGLYTDPATQVGRFLDELYRAGRLVVDTGLHARGWSREAAIRYMVDECSMGQGNAEREVDRYLAWPAQALGYKLGEMTILQIRAQAKERLGPRFDIRKFHDAILEEGHLPMGILRERMDAWIVGQGA
jgi:uncharacterized protein (DUF885 family)